MNQINKAIDWSILKQYVNCHSTPGDEEEVFAIARREMERCNLEIQELNGYALIGRSKTWHADQPTVLLTAHADSPGMMVKFVSEEGIGSLITLGSIQEFSITHQQVLVKRPDGTHCQGKIHMPAGGDRLQLRCNGEAAQRGERVCFKPVFTQKKGNLLQASFLDNRIGCFILHLLASYECKCNLILGLTSNEEYMGTGAMALAHAVDADLVFVLDTTYEDEEQTIELGKGPVLTACDKSVCLSPYQLKTFGELCNGWGIPWQFEIYDYSGTDAEAFPKSGRTCTVLPLLVPSKYNHEPLEIASKTDVLSCVTTLKHFLDEPEAVKKMCRRFKN